MTLPVERTRAVLAIEREARDLHNTYYRAANKAVRVPVEEWEQFMRLFRHYPTAFDLAESARKCPEIWSDETPNP